MGSVSPNPSQARALSIAASLSVVKRFILRPRLNLLPRRKSCPTPSVCILYVRYRDPVQHLTDQDLFFLPFTHHSPLQKKVRLGLVGLGCREI